MFLYFLAIAKENMKRWQLRNNVSNTKSETSNKQLNYCVTLIRKTKQTFFANINTTNVTHNKTIWRTTKLFSNNKVKTCLKITLIEKRSAKQRSTKGNYRKCISNDCDISETFNKFFVNIAPNLKIVSNKNFETAIELD